MKARPWYKRYPDNFLAGMARLTLEEKGAYNVVVDLMYARGGAIADEPRWIAGMCNCSVRKWTTIRARLIDLGKLASDGHSLWNERAMAELGDAAKEAEKQRENGAKGGNKSAEVRARVNENKDLGEASLNHIRGQKTDTPIVPKGTREKKAQVEGYDDASNPLFADFLASVWSKRWKRDGHNRFNAYRAYRSLSLADREAVKGNIDRCAHWLTSTREDATYRPMLQSWLNSRGWETETFDTAPSGPNWSKWVAHFRRTGEWNTVALGPAPGRPGCKAPPELLIAPAA